MATTREMPAYRWQDAVNFLLGVWLFFSPWILGFTDIQAAAWNAYLFGAIIAVDAAFAFFMFRKWEEWLNVIFGAWLVVSPWILGFSGTTMLLWNAVIVGLAVLILAVWSAQTTEPGLAHGA